MSASRTIQPFRRARPEWLAGRSEEMNVAAGWRAVVVGGRRVRLLVATSGLYRLTVDGVFVAHGPARAAHGFFRVDEHDLDLAAGQRVVALEVAGYAMDSYWLLRQPSFVQAEIVAAGEVLAATATGGFTALAIGERVQRVQRYSKQRVASEAWRLAPGWDAWRREAAWRGTAVDVETLPARALLPRIVPLAAYTTRAPMVVAAVGDVARHAPPAQNRRFWWLAQIPDQIHGFRETELATDPLNALQAKPTARIVRDGRAYDPASEIALPDHGFAVLDLGDNLTGFFAARVRCERPCRMLMLFDELARDDGDVDFLRMDCVNAIEWTLEPGDYALETIEPYTARHLKLIALDGGCAVRDVALRGYGNAESGRASFACADRRLVRVFEAARATFAQNAVDVFMDCPSRERAGWLCDSYFTGRVALDLCGTTTVERAFLENFLLPEKFPGLPDGMLPMCYPADHDDGNFIPNWAMFFVLELEEYLARSGDRALIDDLRPRVARLIAYLRGFENGDGLLEKLPKWVFVEWSKANEWVQDVNYPSNMLWAGMLDAAARLYGDGAWAELAARVRTTVRAQSFDGRFFVDNAVRADGALQRTTNTSEVCQYFAFWFGVADRRRDAGLWRTLVEDFGPQRKTTGRHPSVQPANAFIGNYVRLELLAQAGLAKQALDETLGYFHFMAQRTGTLWENDSPTASCNHGFASHVAHLYYRDVLGLAEVDVVHRRLALRFNPHDLDWCEGRIPVGGDEAIEVGWWREGEVLRWRCCLPAGWSLTVDDRTGRAVRA